MQKNLNLHRHKGLQTLQISISYELDHEHYRTTAYDMVNFALP